MSEPAPHYIDCLCLHCSGKIEFDANGLDANKSLAVPCPHCGLETTIFLPGQMPAECQPTYVSDFSDRLLKSPFAKNYPEVVKWLRKGAAAGEIESMALLGLMIFEGVGVEKHHAEAVKCFRRAAEEGHVGSQYRLGICHYFGFGVEKDFIEASKLIRKAAEKGDSEAQYFLGILYHFGHGVAQDRLKAFEWWLKAAEQGYASAQNNVGCLYDFGVIVGQDLVEAYKWMSLAAAQGNEGAEEECRKLATKMTGEQRAESALRILAFKLKNVQQMQPEGYDVIARLAAMGDVEAQAFLALSADQTNFARQAISSEVRREVWRRDQGMCVKCGGRERLEYDHIIPVSKGGSNTARNIELLCESCNRTKSASIQ
jgi:hypothetical protein